MSNRLKRKLGDLGIDVSSPKATESFCLIGTPLPPLEKSKDSGEFVPLWKQEVRDEKGRRRLHGAFTGGFSAGYFNTVGSKEGWAPSSFISSRNDRAKKKTARPEDFMDEEDLQELRDSRKLVDNTEEMDFGGTQTGLQRRADIEETESDSIASALEAAMLPPPKDSVGARILKKMGWKMGQGIGPRVTWHQRKLQELQTKHGPYITADDIKLTEDDEEASKHTYAPLDTPVLVVERKDNFHGLGYRPGMSLNESLGVNSAASGRPKIAAGFGLGALNDADEDDLDIYDGGLSQLKNRTAYDYMDGAEESRIMIGGKQDNSMTSQSRQIPSTQTFRDGRPVLPGFILSDKPVAEDRSFPMPIVPADWKPDPRRIWERDKENIQSSKPSQLPVHGNRHATISADTRGSMLGETPLSSTPRSVFEYMSQKDRERLQNIQATLVASSSSSDQQHKPSAIVVPRIEPYIAQVALRGFQPFTNDPTKQARYTSYLQSQAAPEGQATIPEPLPGQMIHEFNRELEDYAKAAQIFKPISGAMADRFTSATTVEHGPKVHEGIHPPTEKEEGEQKAPEEKKEDKISPKVHAAKMGMYGPLTRETKPWQPARLLCKRFGVKDPNPMPETPASAPTTDTSTSVSSPDWQPPSSTSANISSLPSIPSGSRDLENIGLGEDESQGRDILTYKKPPMNVFKEIFASDEESDDGKSAEEADEMGAEPTIMEPTVVAHPPTSGSEKVDLSSFKPTFIPRDGKQQKSRDKRRDKETREKKKKSKQSVLVSFEMDEDGGRPPPNRTLKERGKKKKQKKEDRKNDDEDMWAEKLPPEVIQSLEVEQPPDPSSYNQEGSAGTKGRKRAIDFM